MADIYVKRKDKKDTKTKPKTSSATKRLYKKQPKEKQEKIEDKKYSKKRKMKKRKKQDNIKYGSTDYLQDEDIKRSLRTGFLSSFLYLPKKARFSTQDRQERIVAILRRHFITNIPWIVVSTLLFAAPLFVFSTSIIEVAPERFRIVGFLMWYLLSMAYLYEKFLSWYFQVAIITDERVVDVDFVNLIYREISAAKIDQIQDVTVQMGGVVRSMFNFGTVFIQTASEKPRIEFADVPKPDVVAGILSDLVSEEEQEKIEGRVR